MLREIVWDQDDDTLRQLLPLSIGFPTPEKIKQRLARYRHAPKWHLLGYEGDCGLIGSGGFQLTAPGEAVINHIAVFPSYQGRGVGRQMVWQVPKRYSLHRLTAETDAEAVGFYRNCGFAIASLGNLYPGVERFSCELLLSAERNH